MIGNTLKGLGSRSCRIEGSYSEIRFMKAVCEEKVIFGASANNRRPGVTREGLGPVGCRNQQQVIERCVKHAKST